MTENHCAMYPTRVSTREAQLAEGRDTAELSRVRGCQLFRPPYLHLDAHVKGRPGPSTIRVPTRMGLTTHAL